MDNNKINEAALTKRLKTLVLQERYEDALKELEDIDIQRLKNNSILCLVGEVYMGLKEYDDAERVLLRVYEKNPTARRILDLLTTLYIEKGEYSEAEYYYKEFISVASKDLHRYILRYRIDKGKNERLSVLIHTLEKLKEYEYIEEWAYELAKLYDESGQTKKCLHECEEIVLWFGHGEYVDKAIALRCKLTGEPLPEMTTVEMYEAEEEKRAQEQKEQERVYAEISRRSANPVVDGIENEFDGSIDTEMIQQTLEGRDGEAGSQKEEVPPAQEAAEEEKSDIPAEVSAEEEKSEEHGEDEDWLKAEDANAADEEDDEIVPENALVSSEKEEKESITQIFGNLMSGKLFGKLLPGKKEEIASEQAEEAVPAEAEETAPAEAEETVSAEAEETAPAEAEETVSAEAEETAPAEAEETVSAEAEEVVPAMTEEAAAADEEEAWDEQEDDEILKGELDLSIFEMKADQAFEDSIIENMDASFRASYGEAPAAAAQEAEEIVSETADLVEENAEVVTGEAEEEAEAVSETMENAEEATEETVEKAEEAAEETVENVEEAAADTENEIVETAEQQAVSFAEAITEAVGEPSAFISEQTEDFVSEEEAEKAEAEVEAETEAEAELETETGLAEETETEIEAEAETEAAVEEPETESEAEAEAEAEESEAETETAAEESETEPEAETEAEAEEPEAETEAAAEESETEPEAEAEEPEAETEAEVEEPEAETEAEAEETEAETEAEAEEPEAETEAEAEETEAETEVAAEEPEVETEAVEPEIEPEAEAEAEPEEETIPEAEAAEAAEGEAIEVVEDEVIEDDDDEDEEDEIIDEDDLEDEIIFGDSEDEFVRSLFASAAGSLEAASAAEEETKPAPEEEEAEDEFSDSLQASDTVMDIFGAVAEVKSIKQQLTETFTKFEFQDSIDLLAPYDINFVVTGEDMSAKSQIAIGIAKALNTYQICDKNKLVRANAEDLNHRDFASIFPKLKGGCLIIESADKLNENSVQIISDYIQKEDQDVAIVLEGEEKPLMEMFSRNRLLRQRFLNIIHIGKYNESELVQLATGYAKKKGYEVSPDAGPVLRTLFRERMQKGESVNYEDIIVIVENAISSLERRNMENLFMTVLDNKYEEAAMFLLQPQDFRPQEEDADEMP